MASAGALGAQPWAHQPVLSVPALSGPRPVGLGRAASRPCGLAASRTRGLADSRTRGLADSACPFRASADHFDSLQTLRFGHRLPRAPLRVPSNTLTPSKHSDSATDSFGRHSGSLQPLRLGAHRRHSFFWATLGTHLTWFHECPPPPPPPVRETKSVSECLKGVAPSKEWHASDTRGPERALEGGREALKGQAEAGRPAGRGRVGRTPRPRCARLGAHTLGAHLNLGAHALGRTPRPRCARLGAHTSTSVCTPWGARLGVHTSTSVRTPWGARLGAHTSTSVRTPWRGRTTLGAPACRPAGLDRSACRPRPAGLAASACRPCGLGLPALRPRPAGLEASACPFRASADSGHTPTRATLRSQTWIHGREGSASNHKSQT